MSQQQAFAATWAASTPVYGRPGWGLGGCTPAFQPGVGNLAWQRVMTQPVHLEVHKSLFVGQSKATLM